MPDHIDLHVDGDRLLRRLTELAEIGPIAGGGVSRLALTEADRQGRDLVVAWMRDLGLDVSIDGIGNVVGVRPGRSDGPPLMMGSHIDTVATGGRYDGNLGVLAGLEVIEALAENDVVTDRPLAVAFFTNEEGSRFPPDMMGSLVYVGGLALESALATSGTDGAVLGDELARIGYQGAQPCPGPPPHAYVELHVEQGPVLEDEGFTIGAVQGVQGISWTEITVQGQSNHAGTTPMRMRHDAARVAGEIVVATRRIAVELGGDQVGTVGSLDLHPNLVNVVAATATLTVDLRNTSEQQLRTAESLLAEELDRLGTDEGVTITTRRLARFEPVEFNADLVDLVVETAEELGHRVRRLPSGAGHDAQMLARVCPAAMIFVPSVAGISHNPAEHTDPSDITAGADVLLRTVLCLAADQNLLTAPTGT